MRQVSQNYSATTRESSKVRLTGNVFCMQGVGLLEVVVRPNLLPGGREIGATNALHVVCPRHLESLQLEGISAQHQSTVAKPLLKLL